MFFQLMIAMMLGLMSPSTSSTSCNSNNATTATTNATDDPNTGGDTGQIHPPK